MSKTGEGQGDEHVHLAGSPKETKAQIERALSAEQLGPGAVLDRLKEALGMDSDSELAWALGVTRQAVWRWRNRGPVPYKEVIFLAMFGRLSLDYVLTGQGTIRFRPDWERADYELLRGVLSLFAESGLAEGFDQHLVVRVAKTYERAEQLMARIIKESAVSPDEARRTALAAVELFDHGDPGAPA